MKASVILSTQGIPGPLAIVSAARTLTAAVAAQKAGAVWLQDILSKKSDPTVEALGKEIKAASPSYESAPRTKGALTLGGQDFVLFSGGECPMGGEAPSGSRAGYTASLPSFGIARTEVTKGRWAKFMAAQS